LRGRDLFLTISEKENEKGRKGGRNLTWQEEDLSLVRMVPRWQRSPILEEVHH
jgi:hypothetical protein